jgi:hypothetical protein
MLKQREIYLVILCERAALRIEGLRISASAACMTPVQVEVFL